jgi:hypothetical protein
MRQKLLLLAFNQHYSALKGQCVTIRRVVTHRPFRAEEFFTIVIKIGKLK